MYSHFYYFHCVVSNSSVNHAVLSARHLQDKLRLENLSWRLWYRHQQKTVTYPPSEDTNMGPTPSSNKIFILMDEDDDDDDDCYSISSSVSSCSEEEWFSQQKIEDDDLVFQKKRDHDDHLYFTTATATATTSKQPISLLTQMLQNSQQQQVSQVQPKTELLKRCQSRYQGLDEWFATSS